MKKQVWNLGFALSFAAFIGLVGCESSSSSEQNTDKATSSTSAEQTATKSQASASAGSTEETAPAEAGLLKFETLTQDFGTVEEGEVIEKEYKFTVEGEYPVTISEVKPSCGCTASGFPRSPIQPGESAVIKLTFKSEGRPGSITKTAQVISDAKGKPIRLTLTGMVNPKAEGPVKQ